MRTSPAAHSAARLGRPDAGSWRRRTGAALSVGMLTGLVGVLPMAGTASADPGPAPICDADTCTVTFPYTGASASWQVPTGVTSATFDLYGAEGGLGGVYAGANIPGGKGAHVRATTTVTAGETLVVVVGGRGRGNEQTTAGFNGGGQAPAWGGTSWTAGGGGGASDVRRDDTRLLVAGGGGGGGGCGGVRISTYDVRGGDGGASSAPGGGGGGSSDLNGRGGDAGSDVAGGAAGAPGAQAYGRTPASAGSAGQGGQGGADGGGGGGGGYFGGGGGGGGGDDWNDGAVGSGGGGGGGSNLVTGVDTSTADGARSGDGEVVITYPLPDLSAPVIDAHDDLTTEATSSGGTVVSYTAPTATDDRDGSVPVSCTPASGTLFRVGTTGVTCTATDAAGNTASSTFRVSVADRTVPAITTHGNVTVTAVPGATSAVATYTAPTATDTVDGTIPATCAPASGATFAVGTTTVMCTAADRAGNRSSSSFLVTVNPGAPVPTRADLTAVVTGPSTAKAGSRITYTLKVTNHGPAMAASLTSVLSTTGLTGITASAGSRTGSVKIGSVTVSGTTWTMPSLASGQSVTYTVAGTVSAKKGQYVTALAGGGSTTPDPNALNNLATYSTKVS